MSTKDIVEMLEIVKPAGERNIRHLVLTIVKHPDGRLHPQPLYVFAEADSRHFMKQAGKMMLADKALHGHILKPQLRSGMRFHVCHGLLNDVPVQGFG